MSESFCIWLAILTAMTAFPTQSICDRPTMSRATMMRMVKELGDQIVVGGAARRTSYAARRPIRGNSNSLPLYQIDEQGRGSQVATLDPIYPSGCLLKLNEKFEWPLTEEMKDGWFPGLPYPLDDMRPQGFLGRHFAHAHAPMFQVSEDPTRWSEDDVLAVLSILGADTPGNLILGEPAYRRYLQRVQEGYLPIIEEQILTSYRNQALQALEYGVATSSAGGEFPKFTTCRFQDGKALHVIVKFSGNDQTPVVTRWADLLVCEHIALKTIGESLRCFASQSIILQTGHRIFLEVQRFDRHGEFGRSAVCTWAAIEAAMFGIAGVSWIVGGQRLLKEGMISATTFQQMSLLWYFGKLIGNTDMHEGNLSFKPSSTKGMLELAPAYDMLPMLYAPPRGVELPKRTFTPELPLPQEVGNWRIAAKAAEQFWMNAGSDNRISKEFRTTCSQNGRVLAAALRQFS